MSQENVEIVRAIIDAVNRQDFEAAFKDSRLRALRSTCRAQLVRSTGCSQSIDGGEP